MISGRGRGGYDDHEPSQKQESYRRGGADSNRFLGAALVAIGVLSLASSGPSQPARQFITTPKPLKRRTHWDKTFSKSDQVDVEKVELRQPSGAVTTSSVTSTCAQSLDRSLQHPAIIVGHP